MNVSDVSGNSEDLTVIRYDAKLSSKNQVTVPARVREVLGVGAEDALSFVICGNVVTVQPATMTMADLFQSIPPMKRKPDGSEFTLEEVMDLDGEFDILNTGEVLG